MSKHSRPPKKPIAKKVASHLKEDMHESRESISEDKKLLNMAQRAMKKK